MTTKAQLLAARYTEVTERLTKYKEAEEMILNGAQSYSVGSRTLTRADLKSIAERIEKLEKEQLKLLNNGSIRIQRVVHRSI